MYVIATVICPNFHFSVSPHVPFLNLLFEQIANSNAYLLAKFGFDTAENEPCKVCPLSVYRSPRYTCFPRNYFHVSHMRNALDHAFDPVEGILQLLHVTKPGGFVLLRHAQNEGVRGRVERFGRRGTEPFEPFEPFEFFQNRNFSLENSKISENFNIFIF